MGVLISRRCDHGFTWWMPGFELLLLTVSALLLAVSAGCGHNVIDPGSGSRPLAQHAMQVDATTGHLRRVPVSQVIDLPRRDVPAKYHTVQSGETLSGIAAGQGLSLRRLLNANGLEISTKLQPGQLIYIPSNP